MIRRLASTDAVRTNRPFEPVVRERLLERFDAAAAYRVTIVAAPAGFGKSVAVRHSLEARRIEHVRCGLRREHGTLLAFLGAFAAALEDVAPNMVHAYASFYANVERSATMTPGIAQWIATMLRSYRGTIFIDDLHHVRDDSRVGELLAEIVERTSDDVRWIFAARDSHVLPVATWLAYGVADVPIDESDLRLTFDEAAAAARACDVALSADHLGELLALTEGWATAFAFALRASTRTSELASVALGTRDMIYAFLAEQVFRSLEDRDRDFLLRTAPLPTLDLRVLREAEFEDPQASIERLRRTTAFITEDSDRVYRYHDLFRDYVEHELRKNDAHFARACDDAAAWSLRAGATVDALELYAKAGNDEAIVGILETHGAELFDRGEVKLLDDTLERLPRSQIDRSPLVLAVAAMVASLRGRFDIADVDFTRAVALDCDANARAHVAMRYAITLSWRWRFADALAAVSEIDPAAIESLALRARFLAFKAYALSGVRRPEASALAMEALALARGIDDVTLEVTVLQYVALVAMYERRLDASSDFAGRALELAERHKLFGPAGRVAMLLAAIASERGDDEANLWHVMRMRKNAEQIGDKVAIDSTTMMAYSMFTQQGNLEKIAEIEAELPEMSSWVASGGRLPLLQSSIAMQHAWAGRFGEAYVTIADSANYAGPLPDASWRNASRLAEIALYAAAAGEKSAANKALGDYAEKLVEFCDDERLYSYEMQKSRLTAALSAIVMENYSLSGELLSSVEKDSAYSTPGMRAFVKAVRALCIGGQVGIFDDSTVSAISKLKLSTMGGFARLIEALPIHRNQVTTPDFGLLTPTERVILSFIAGGATSKAVATEMGRSALTVDSHVKSIIRKLGCSGRREAVALARDHGYVSPRYPISGRDRRGLTV